jgi:hypothetical protein
MRPTEVQQGSDCTVDAIDFDERRVEQLDRRRRIQRFRRCQILECGANRCQRVFHFVGDRGRELTGDDERLGGVQAVKPFLLRFEQ